MVQMVQQVLQARQGQPDLLVLMVQQDQQGQQDQPALRVVPPDLEHQRLQQAR